MSESEKRKIIQQIQEEWSGIERIANQSSNKPVSSFAFNQVANWFNPGSYYYYVVNFTNLQMDYVHPNSERILGISADSLTVNSILNSVVDTDIELFQKKEQVAAKYLFEIIPPERLMDYKSVYRLRMKVGENIINILHQAQTIEVTKDHKMVRVLGIHTVMDDVFSMQNDKISIISSVWPSYKNIDLETGEPDNITIEFTNRETEILKMLSSGKNNREVAEALHISELTVKTHRQNLIRKSDCRNITELISKSITRGWL